MAPRTIEQFTNQARILLQDTTPTPRYSDDELRSALALAFDEAYRVRPDFFINVEPVFLAPLPPDTVLPIPRGYAMAFLFFMVGYVQLRDAEDTVDARAGVFVSKFTAQLLTTPS